MQIKFMQPPGSLAVDKFKASFAVLLCACMALFAPSSRAEDLHYFKNYFVTGDYAVEGVGLYAKGVNGLATGTITMTAAKDVPSGADIVAAYLYWETVETTATPSSMNGSFDFDSTGKPYPIVGDVVANPNAVPCWSQGGTGGPGTYLRVYRADVLRYLNVDPNGQVRDVDYTHTVRLPDSGINQPGSVPHTEGASLVVVYRQLTGTAPYKAVVIYDGAYTMTKSSPAFSQTIGGFYDAAGSGGRMTQIVGNGQPNFAETLTVNGSVPSGVSGTPFDGATGSRWDNLTFAINLALGANQLTTQVTAGNNQVCLSWGAVLMSTNVVNTDGDGILDSWKTKGLHLNVGKPATSTSPSVPATFGGCADDPDDSCENLPAMGAVLGTPAKPHKDVFIQIDWMQGNDGHIHAPKLAALRAIAAAFSAHQIYVHFDVGIFHYQQFTTKVNNYMIIPAFYAEGGNFIKESSLECPNNVIVNVADCEYDTKDLGYLVLGWKTGIGAIKDGFSLLNIPQHFAHDRKDIFHYMLLAHALAGPIDTKPGPGNGLPVSPPPSVSGVGDLFGGDVLVTLGLWRTDNPTIVISKNIITPCLQDDPTGLLPDADLCTDQTGTSLVQAGTMFHELGHNLGLHHGGAVDTPNCMPDYPSTMNYLYQTRGLTGAMGDVTGVANGIEHIDYSTGMLLPLNENSLNGTPMLGIMPYRLRYYGPATSLELSTSANAKANCSGTYPAVGTPSVRLETSAPLTPSTVIDWSNGTTPPIGVLSPGLYSEDIDFSGAVGDSIAGNVGFADHDDWDNLNLQQIGGRPNVGGLSGDVGPTDISTADQLGQIVLGQNTLGQNTLGQNTLGESVLGQNTLGQNTLGQNTLGSPVLGQNTDGQNTLGQNTLGEIDYDTAISTLDATGASTPLVAAPSASTGTAYNRVTLTWGAPSLGQIRTYTVYRTNLNAAILDPVVAGTVTGTPPATVFNDAVSDPNLSHIGANCPSTSVCYDTNYQYYIVASTTSNSSTPSNLVTVTVDHLYVSAYTGMVVYGNALPDYSQSNATVSGLPVPGITSASFTCTNTSPAGTPRNVGSYVITCTGPATFGSGSVYGVSYLPGTLMITQRPLYIDAVTNTKLYDSTTTANGVPVVEAAVANVSGLAYSDTVSGSVEAYLSPNVLGVSASTLSVTAYTVNDGNSGKNYNVNSTKTAAGTITARPLYIDAVTNTKLYDSTTTASALPVPEATVANVSGLVGSDKISGQVEAYASPNVLGVSGSTLSVTKYAVNDGNGGKNYSVTATKTAFGTITARPLYIDAVTNTKLYDSTTSASALPAAETTVANVSGLVGSDNITGQVEAYASPKVLGLNGSTLLVTIYTVNDGNLGNNYTVTTKTAAGTITARPLYLDAVTYTKLYDSTPIAGATPVVGGTVAGISGLVGGDNVTGLTEVYQSPNALGANGSTLAVATYAVSDGNGGSNYTINLVGAPGTITPRPLIIDAQPNTKTFDGTTTAAAVPVVEGPSLTTGLVGGDGVTGLAETYDTANVGTGKTLTVSTYTITPSSSGGNYTVSTSANTSGEIDPAPLTATVSGSESSAPPTFAVSGISYAAFAGTDTQSVVSGNLACDVVVTSLGSAGSYPISCTGLSATNYNITYDYSQLTGGIVAAMPATLTVNVLGTVNTSGSPTFAVTSYTLSGLLSPDTPAVVTGTPACTVLALDASNNYPLSCTGLIISGATNTYNIVYSYSYGISNATPPTPLTVAVNGSVNTSGASPVFTINSLTYSGFINGDTPSVVSGALSCTLGAQVAGNYPISCLGLTAGSYNISYDYSSASGTTAATSPTPLIVTVTGTESTSPSPSFTIASSSYSGFVNGDLPTVVSGTLSCTSSATADSAGNYAISCAGLKATNYIITYSYSYSPGADIITMQAPLTVAVSATKASAVAAPVFTVTYSGFINGDTVSAITGPLSCTVAPGLNALSFKISNCTGLSAPGYYTISYWLGTGKIL